jgi:hypothetical protein
MAKRKTTLASRRAQLEAAIDQAIELLNSLDGDADLEPTIAALTCVGSCAPGANGQIGFSQVGWARGDNDESEDEHDGIEPDTDEEDWRQPVAM